MLVSMDILSLYRETGAYLEGHFLLASGRHSPKFLQSTTVMQYPQHAEVIGKEIAKLFADTKADFVVGPAMGGIILAHTVAKALGCRALFAEKDGSGNMTLRDAFAIRPGERFIAVEDVITTGGSLKKAIAAAEHVGASCVGIGCIIERGLSQFPANLAPRALTTLNFPSFGPADCPLCQQGIPLEEV